MTDRSLTWDRSTVSGYARARLLTAHASRQWSEALAPHITSTDRVLDLGCGVGLWTQYFIDWFDCDVVPADASLEMLGAAASYCPGGRFVAASAYALPYRLNSIDVVWLSNVIHHVDAARVAAEAITVLRAGGRAIVRNVFPDHADDMPLYRFFPAARELDDASYPTIDEVILAFQACGLDLRDQRTVWQTTATSWHEYWHRTRNRAVSSLRLIADDEFAEGLDALQRHASAESTAEVVTPMELLVFT